MKAYWAAFSGGQPEDQLGYSGLSRISASTLADGRRQLIVSDRRDLHVAFIPPCKSWRGSDRGESSEYKQVFLKVASLSRTARHEQDGLPGSRFCDGESAVTSVTFQSGSNARAVRGPLARFRPRLG